MPATSRTPVEDIQFNIVQGEHADVKQIAVLSADNRYLGFPARSGIIHCTEVLGCLPGCGNSFNVVNTKKQPVALDEDT